MDMVTYGQNLKESLKNQGLNVQDLNVSVDSGRSQNEAFEIWQNTARLSAKLTGWKIDIKKLSEAYTEGIDFRYNVNC